MNISYFRKTYSYFVVNTSKRFKISVSSADTTMKVFTQKRNPITGSTEWDMQHEDYDFHQEIARSAFADMLHDTERNKKYYSALQLAIEKMHKAGKKAHVLDIGTGTGLLSIMAARCGADTIVACEAFKPMAECCLKILAQNNVADKITVIPKRSTELTVGQDGDMQQKANILVTEVFDTELIGEGALQTFSHAHQNLLEKNCIVVPDSAVIYAQVAACPFLQEWNKLNDLANEDMETILKVPQKIKDCPGSAAVHDIQLSQVPRHMFFELSDQIPVFYYDWSGRTPIDMKRTVKQKFTASSKDEAQMVFMWWELNMDPEGKIVLSCAPWWTHPDAKARCVRPQDTIPWRDHWMQAVYYLPKPIYNKRNYERTLVCCHDDYSLWFYLENEDIKFENYQRPVCECGVHMAFSRTHLAYLNDTYRSKKHLSHLKEKLKEIKDPIVLDLNGSTLLGLAAAKMGAKKVYVLETMNLNIGFLNDYIAANDIDNVEIISDLNDELLSEIEIVVCDPNFSNAILPWENLKVAYLLHKCKNKLRDDVVVIPESCEFWAVPVEFQDLHKIRVPLDNCEGINMSAFDELVESSRTISDAEIEAQPMWEYRSRTRGRPRKLLHMDLGRLQVTYANNEAQPLSDKDMGEQMLNGFVIWAYWIVGGKALGGGPTQWPDVGDTVIFDPYTRQAVKILKQSHKVTSSDMWSYQVACDLENGQFDINLNLVPTPET